LAADVIELARRHDEAFNSHDPDGRMAIESSDVEVMYPGGLELRGPEQVLEMVKAFWEAMPDGKIAVESQLASGDAVFGEGTLTGTQTGVFRTPQGELPASGNRVSLRYASVKRFEDGRLVSEHLYFDQLDFLQQLGAVT
jgi:steroid delta-isomerase-like uncharacterized protein